jgi:hypothetical protein
MTHAVLQLTKSAFGHLTRTLFTAAACVLLAASASPAVEPAVIISVKGFDELLADVGYLGEVVNQPQFGGLAQALIAQMTGGQGLKGLDGSKPIGAYVTLSPEGQPKDIVVFVPVSDQEEFAATLATLSPNFEKVGDLTQYQFPINPNPVLGKAGVKYFFFAPEADMLKETADPSKLVTVPADISLELDLTKIPDSLKELFVNQAEAQAAAKNQETAPEDPAQRAIQEGTTKLLNSGLRRMVLDGSRMTLSLDINSKTKAIMLDLACTAKSGTTLAKATANYAKTENPFSGLISKQTLGSYVVSAPLSTDTEAMFKMIVDESEKKGLADLPADKAAKESMTKVLKQVADVARATIQRGRWDHSIVVNAVDGKLQMVSATKVAKGDQINKALEELVKNNSEAKDKVKLNVAQVGKGKVHSVKLPDDDDTQKYFGSEPLHMVVNEDSIIFVAGGDSLKAVKGAFDKPAASTSTTKAPISIRVGISKILEVINEFNPTQIPPVILEQSKSALEGGLDQIALEVSSQPQGFKIRLEVQEGVLRLGAIAAMPNN